MAQISRKKKEFGERILICEIRAIGVSSVAASKSRQRPLATD
jgi:hypothetical protein